MNIEEKIRILLNKTIDYDSRILKPNFVSELTTLLQQEREKAVGEFVGHLDSEEVSEWLHIDELNKLAELFLKESEGK